MRKKKVVLCGSMQFIEQMRMWKDKLEKRGYDVDTPTLFDFHQVRDKEGDLEKFYEIKRRETKNHFEKVEGADMLLILNYDKNGVRNYIGGNTFAEVAYAVALNYCDRRQIDIRTLNPIPLSLPYSEELFAWEIKQWEES